MADQESIDLLNRFRGGDDHAAQELFDRYVHRLIGVARNRLSLKLARRVDPEDIVQSAYRSFFRGADEGGYALERSGDLWRLLVAITINKLRMQARRHRAAKRDLACEESLIAQQGTYGLAPERVAQEPDPEEAVAVAEQLEQVMDQLDSTQRQILELRLQGHTIEEIAESVSRSERTVRRLLDRVKHQLKRDFESCTG